MVSYPTEYNVVYVDRRARQDRIQPREDSLPSPISSGPESYDGSDGIQDEHEEVIQNLQCLLSVFNSVSICVSGPSCISLLSEVDKNDPSPTLVLLDIPWDSQPAGEETDSYEGRHDSGVDAGPGDKLYGLPLLKFICVEMENKRMSGLVVPIVFLTNPESSAGSAGQNNGQKYWNNGKEPIFQGRELECIDFGAVDVLTSPLPKDRAKTLYMHCHRARRNIQRSRKVSWVGVDERSDEQKSARETSEYAYLREKMVSELMMDICKPKKTVFIHRGNQPKILPTRIEEIKQAISSWNFSAHDFSDEELVCSALLMFEHALQMPEVHEFRLPTERIMDFLTACRASYNPKVPYHNFRHVVDVLQAVFYFLLQLRALPSFTPDDPSVGDYLPPNSLSNTLTPLDALTLLVVAIGHDVGHPGVNNAFLVTLKAPLAQVYNDKSVLESFHCAAFSQVLRKYWPKCLELRKAMIDMILATDMGLHFEYMGKLDKMRKMFEKDGSSESWDKKTISEHKTLICALLIKCADISNVARVHECSAQWATILIDEFSRQASMETDLKIPTSLVVPPVTGSVLALAKSQVGFMSLFAVPLFQQLSDVLPEMKFSVDVLKENKSKWAAKIETFAPNSDNRLSGNGSSKQFLTTGVGSSPDEGGNRNGNTGVDKLRNNSTTHQQSVLGPVLMESEHHVHSRVPTRVDSQRSVQQCLLTDSAEQTKVKVVVTQPNQPLSTNGNALKPSGEKRPTYQHSSEHLSAQKPTESAVIDRPRSSPPDLGDSSDHSCTKGCCGATTNVVIENTVARRPSSFFKKVKSWRSRRKDHSSDA
ncbi:uncharacterized protein H6S33_009249 [Morchella sextelata]|uniref:uncharacterized protein n=1 Tax=Morchella sextelata TaxID=1174677 RepID=UPI001D03C269|nr:uncharacterized protein H6S33_009249 [Morchella sextelata]KAH0612869.1 hypothetical protein H6S33_009249 [Morchella sextelata]